MERDREKEREMIVSRKEPQSMFIQQSYIELYREVGYSIAVSMHIISMHCSHVLYRYTKCISPHALGPADHRPVIIGFGGVAIDTDEMSTFAL